MGNDPKRSHVFFTGRVQGVYFRANTLKKAREFGLSGWVRNLRDGRVEAVFEGPEPMINAVVSWCKDSMPLANVISVEQFREEPEGVEGFEILQ